MSVHDEFRLSGEKTILSVKQITHDLHHPSTGRLVHNAANLNAAAGQVDDNENVVPDKATKCEDLHRQEVPGPRTSTLRTIVLRCD